MCPRFKDNVCEVAGIKPDYVECVDSGSCYKDSGYERCRLYIVEYMLNNSIGVAV